MSAPPRILVVRRDNIGDLVCTTPLLRALRQRFPDAWIAALVNSYNAPVLRGNPDLNEVFAYRKLKHREPGESVVANVWARCRLLARLRRESPDYVLFAGNAPRATGFTRLLRAGRTVGFAAPGWKPDIVVDPGDTAGEHEVEISFRLARAFDVAGPPPVPAVYPDPALVARLRERLPARLPGRLAGMHISARKPSQRWPIERYAELAHEMTRRGDVGVLLFWSPGPATDPRHPGDDGQAQALCAELRELPVVPVPTAELGELIAGLSLCRSVVCSDGGAMHLAAALGKPIVCLFGRSDAARWHPYGVRHVLLQPPSLEASDISVADVLSALAQLG